MIMNEIKTLLELDMAAIFLSLIVILSAGKIIIELFNYFLIKFGIETKFTKRAHKLDNVILEIAELKKQREIDVIESIKHDNEIRQEVKSIKNTLTEDSIDNRRWQILEFANSLSNEKSCSKEQFSYIYKLYDKYEKIIEANHLTNGEIEDSMQFIREEYQRRYKTGF